FGGRTMRSDKNLSKYVNSPESQIYRKNLELYGLYQAKSAISRRDKCILVEGYLDVISMHQAGVENVVASSGTSLTEGQISAIRRFTNNVTVIYDADAAGIKASLRGINMLLAEKMDVKVLLLPDGDDPDSFAQSHSAGEVEAYLADNERDIIAFMTDVLMRDVPAGDPTAKAKVVNVILGSVAHVDDAVKRQEYLTQCSRMLGLSEDVLVRQLNVLITGRYVEEEKNAAREQARASVEKTEENTGGGVAVAPLINIDTNRLRPYEEMLMRYLVRYGLMYFVEIDNSDGTRSPATVYDVIANELAIDGISFTHPPYAATFEAVRSLRDGSWQQEREQRLVEIEREAEAKLEEARAEIRRTGGSIAQIEKLEAETRLQLDAFRRKSIDDFDMYYVQSRLTNSDSDDVRKTAVELVVDRYTLSRIYTRQGGVETEQDQLATLVPRAVYELRNAIITGIIGDLTAKLATAGSGDDMLALLSEINEYKALQSRLAAALGDRIILPRGV
ncbi:MAG: toprim domain-containing protein, partial [Muribaculaceae bacterium]|nr:toprim domain-containing protein [Muribaculaceae bacterium]